MIRTDIIKTIGREFFVSNIENDEFSFSKALKEIQKDYTDYVLPNSEVIHKDVDLRFVGDNLTVLVETKPKFKNSEIAAYEKQLQQYVIYEKELTNNKIIAILAETQGDQICVWQDGTNIITEEHKDKNEKVFRPFIEYKNIHFGTKNNKIAIIQSTYALNELLHTFGINEKIRSQFVGTCLLALKNGLIYEGLTTAQIRAGIEDVLTSLLEKDLNKATKLTILKNKVVDSQDVRDLKDIEFQAVLRNISKNILPYINDKSTVGQDLLNLFFTTFNKYVGKSDKNQAFTPDHIVRFMCKVVGINRGSYVLDPCCGSGAFLVRALTQAIDDCDNPNDIKHVMDHQIFGIEYEETAFGLATTNMLIHGDGNSNIVQGNCFEVKNYVDAGINVVLMNPPYNAQRKHCHPEYVKTWSSKTKEDPSKGFHYVYEIAKQVKTGKLAVLLPTQCAIGSEKEVEIRNFKRKMLEEHTLDAVFSFPTDMFHPGANANACCMIFNLGVRHRKSPVSETFFGYFRDDGFVKRKKLGRIEREPGIWDKIEQKWLELYFYRKTEKGLSVTKKVTAEDEWLAEAYMETDYSILSENNFQKNINDYRAYNMKHQPFSDKEAINMMNWEWFDLGGEKGIFKFEPCKCSNASELLEDGNDIEYVGAKKEDGGFMKMVASVDGLVTKGNCIVFICDGQGSVGYTNYKEKDFIGSTTLSVGRNPHLNKYVGLFLVAVLDCERYRYSFGRKYKTNLEKTKIKLPAKDGNPDWNYMEEYIKSLKSGNKV